MSAITPLEKVNSFTDINLYIKRDDLYPISGGGNKGRKLNYILKKCLEEKCNAVVTCGGIQSNHARATAIRCCELGIECTIIIHSTPLEHSTGNLKILELLGVRLVYCELSDISKVMDLEMERYCRLGYSPFYIWGGGHCYEGTLAYFDAVAELKEQSEIEFDAVFLASGTGATQAGLHCGFKHYYNHTIVHGISVARDQNRGTSEIKKSVEEFVSISNLNNNYINNIIFTDKYNCGGYEKTCNELSEIISKVAKNTGIILDPVYTGKAWMGMENIIKTEQYPKHTNVLFWHTGGLLNLMA
ncbi:1-aminocyclopropane-1-carboxylate deaminase/D-cysteine desulfhydrase [Providencia sp. PROV191]|uniref:Pyridoxal-phosphate dependent enzyme n=1 Tax=Providencia stuartii TaxID=588 RepID=A0AAI9DFN0_PROST|nr:pyridoxal-phosphate dependent enzyme [Providencia sp. PROV191]ELR5114719.1 pyridoxal-phosphate dependent enzyme [Providencia stuartii]